MGGAPGWQCWEPGRRAPRLAPWARGTFSGVACRRCSGSCSRPCAAPSTCPGHSAVSTSECPRPSVDTTWLCPALGGPGPAADPPCVVDGAKGRTSLWHLPGPCLSQLLPCCSVASPWAQTAFSGDCGSAFAACCKSSGPSFTLPPTSGLSGLSGRGLGSGDSGGEPDGRSHLVDGATLWAESPLLAREEAEAVQFSSVAQSRPTLCDPMDCGTDSPPSPSPTPGTCSNSCPSSQ